MKTILVTGFSPFPGMPVNPTASLIARLKRRLPHHRQSILFHYALLPTTWAGRQRVSEGLRQDLRPNAIVHFGVDGSRRQINMETRAVNRATRLKPDADGIHAAKPRLEEAGEWDRSVTLPALPLVRAVRASGVAADLSRNAGTYLCNATLWDSLGSGIPSIFIHVPSLRGAAPADRRLAAQALELAARRVLQDIARRL